MALNFLVTGVKMLKKSLDKKKMKEGAKKFVGGDKEDKRARVSKIMDEESSYGEKSKVKKPATISKSKLMKIDIDKVAKVTPDSAKIDYKVFTEKVDNIVGMTDALAFLTGAQSEQKKDELKLLRQQREAEKKKKKEAKLEKKDGMLGKVGKGIKKAAQSPLDAMINFFVKMALGALALFLIKNADKIKKIFQTIGENLEGFSKLLRVTIFGFKEGMKLAKASIQFASKKVSKLLSPIKNAFASIGNKFTGVLKSLGGKLAKVLSKIPGVKQIGQMINATRKGVDASRTVLTGLRTTVTSGITSTFNRVTGNVLRRGVERAPTRMLIKFFGGKTAKAIVRSPLIKFIGKAAKGIKVPVLGPIIVAVTSILSGDKIGKTLFRTLGAVFGGMIGAGIAAGFSFGAAAPLGMLLGEIIGEFIGGFLADMFFGDETETKGIDFLKKKFGQLLDGGKVVMDFALGALGNIGNFFKDGFTRFIDDFPTVKVPKIMGLQAALGAAAGTLGLDEKSKFIEKGKGPLGGPINLVTSLPNLALLTPFGLPFLLPHLKNSFFPAEEKEQVPEASTSGGEVNDDEFNIDDEFNMDDEFIGEFESTSSGTNAVRYYDKEGNEIDALSPEAESLKKEAVEMLKGNEVSSNVSAVSGHASYEQSGSTTVLLTEEPQRSEFASDAQYQQAMILHMNQKEVLNNLYKTNAKVHLYKI